MSATRRSKRDVDRFVGQIQQSERISRGYQIALLYFEVKEYEQAKGYLADYICTKRSVPQAHKLMGQIHEGLGDKREALASYKKSFELDKNQKALSVKICELYTDLDNVDPEILKRWIDQVEQDCPTNPILFRAKEKILMSKMGRTQDEMEKFYADQMVKNSSDVNLHIKVMNLYLEGKKSKDALDHAMKVEKSLVFIDSLSWYEFLIELFHAYAKSESTAEDMNFHKYRLLAFCQLTHLQIQQKDIMDCVTSFQQFDQFLFEANLLSSSRQSGPQWIAFVNEMKGQFFFLYGLLLLKRAKKNQMSWKDAVLYTAVCFLVSNTIPCMDTRNSWYMQLKAEQKFYDYWRLMGCYRLSQGGHIVIPVVEGEKVFRMQELRQLRTPQARDKLYDKMFTLRNMREKKTTSFLMRSDLFCKCSMTSPSKQSLEEYDRGTFQLFQDNLHQLVWVAMNQFPAKDNHQGSYPLEVFDKFPFMTSDLKIGSPESLCQLDIQTFFYATVMCSAQAYTEQQKIVRSEPYKPFLLPAYLCGDLCQQGQNDWWQAMIKFMNNSFKESFAKSRLLLQKGIETVRLIGSHGMSAASIVHLAKTFDERVKDLKAGEFDSNSRCTKLESMEAWAAHYWREATILLARMKKGQKIHLPKERIFLDSQTSTLSINQLPDLIEQAKFSLGTVAMREGRFEEAKELFETLKQPWASYYLSQIYRTLADRINSDEQDANSQKQTLVERALETLYQTLDKIQADKNHALHRIIPTDVDDCVNQLEMLRSDDLGTSSMSGFGINHDEDETSGEEIYNTPTAPGKISPPRLRFESSPSHYSMSYSTPAAKFSNESVRRPSPERLEARMWAIEKKQETVVELLQSMKERYSEIKEEQAEFKELIREMKEFMYINKTRVGNQYPAPLPPPPPMPYVSPHQFPGYQQLPPPSMPNWCPPSYGYPAMSPTPGGGPMSRRGLGRNSQIQQMSELEDEMCQFGEDVYEDDGSQPPPHMYNIPESQLMQDWPFGHKTGLEGKSTITYSPQNQGRMPQPGSFASALRGQALQYAYNHMTSLPTGQGQCSMPGPGFFSTPKPQSGIPGGQTLQGQGIPTQPTNSQASILAQVLATKSQGSSSATMTTASMPPNVVAGQNMMSRPDLTQGMSGNMLTSAACAGVSNETQKSMYDGLVSGVNPTAIFSTVAAASTGSNVPLFGSLVAASKSPDKKTFVQSASELTGITSGATPSFVPSTISSIPTPSTSASLYSASTVAMSSSPSVGATSAGPTATTVASPFAGFSFKPTQTSSSASPFTGFGTSTVQSLVSPEKISPQKQSGPITPGQSPRKRNDSMEEFEPDVNFKPIVDLPDLVEVKSGEEEEVILFSQRAKLFRFDTETKEWKERGVGEMKILKHTETKKVRVLMRRDQVLKLCANHVLTKEMKLTPMHKSDKTWCWFANDFSGEELKLEHLAVKFKTSDLAQKFKDIFEEQQKNLKSANKVAEQVEEDKFKTKENKTIEKQNTLKELLTQEEDKSPKVPLSEMFKPAEGSWSCNTCLVVNSADKSQCASCTAAKPGVETKETSKSSQISQPKQVSGSYDQSLAEMFKPKEGSWSCNTCLIQNTGDKLKCAACETLRPGVKPEDVKSDTSKTQSKFTFGKSTGGNEAPKSGGFSIGTTGNSAQGAFVFGNSASCSQSGSGFQFGTSTSTGSGTGFSFGTPAKSESSNTTPSSGFSFGTPAKSESSNTTPSSGFKFGASTKSETSSTDSGSGFRFGTSSQPESSGTTPSSGFNFGASIQPESSGTTPSSGFRFGTSSQPESSGANLGSGFKFGTTSQSEPSSTGSEPGFQFGSTTQSEPAKAGFSFGKISQPEFKLDTSKDSSTSLFGATNQENLNKGGNKVVAAEADSSSQPSEGQDKNSDQSKTKSGLASFSFVPSSNKGFQFGISSEGGMKDQKPFSFAPAGSPEKTSGESSGFQFTTKSPEKKDTSPFKFTFTPTSSLSGKGNLITSPKSLETSTDGMYINKEGEDDHIHFEPIVSLPNKADLKTGEEDETVLFEHRAKLFRFQKEEWRERGLGNIKILQNKNTGKIRIIMRREQVLKICCNHYISPEMELRPMLKTEGKAWLWFAMDFADEEQKNEQFSIRFKTAEIAENFKKAFDSAKATLSLAQDNSAAQSGVERDNIVQSPSGPTGFSTISESGSSSDVIFVKEEKATEEQIQKARKYMLPENFYLYETKEPCPGCPGCEDYEPGKGVSPERKKSPKKDTVVSMPSAGLFSSGAAFGTSSAASGGVFGNASNPASSNLFGSTAIGGGDSANSGNLFGATSSNLFSGGSSSFSFSDLASKTTSNPTAFIKDDSQPFSWSGAGQKLFGQSGEDEDDSEVEESYDPHFEPIVSLPEIVEVKTGEEDFEQIFSHRAKLFRYDGNTNQWKEKGIGEMKIQKKMDTGQYRLLMRREQVLKLACNHWLSADLNFQPLQTSETSWFWVAKDYSGEEPVIEKFAVKFKTQELAKAFKDKIDECQHDTREQQASKDRAPVQVSETDSKVPEVSQTSDIYQRQKEEEEEEDQNDDDYEDVEDTLFEKRVTFFSKEKDQWIGLGTGTLTVLYDDDVNGNKVTMTTDEKQIVCNHLIALESNIISDKKTKTCEWTPIDFSTDDAVRRHFKAQFSSEAAMEEFLKHFIQGRALALDSEISERNMMTAHEIDIPEVHGRAVEYD